MFYADFEGILVSGNNGKQNPVESYTSKYQKNVACSYGYKLVCVNDNFRKPFKSATKIKKCVMKLLIIMHMH